MRARERRSFGVIDGGAPPDEEEEIFTITDYLQLAQLGHKSVVVSIDGAHARGEIVIRGGEAWSAHDARGEGEPAFHRLVTAAGLAGHLPARVRALGALGGARNLDQPLAALIMEAARRFDEARKPAAPSAHDDVAEDHFTAFVEDGIDALLRKDYAEAFEAFSAAARLRPGDSMVQTNLSRLRALGQGGTAPSAGERGGAP